MNTVARQTLTVCVISMLSLMHSGCALMAPPSRPPERAVLNQLPRDFPTRARHVSRLLVLLPETAPPYDTLQMAYSTQPHEIAYFSHHEWSALPAQMIFPLLTETMEKTGYFAVVITPPYSGPYDYALRTKILELQQDFTSGVPAVRLSLRLELTEAATHEVVAAKDIDIQQPMTDKTPYAGVTAANTAISTALQQTAGFVLEKASVSETARAP